VDEREKEELELEAASTLTLTLTLAFPLAPFLSILFPIILYSS